MTKPGRGQGEQPGTYWRETWIGTRRGDAYRMAGARTLLREADELLLHRPGLGNLVSEAEALRAELTWQRESNALGVSSLTDAELRLLPLLSTYLPVAEIAEQMRVPRRTIKSRAVSIYRKLGAASRSQAVSRARELGLLEG